MLGGRGGAATVDSAPEESVSTRGGRGGGRGSRGGKAAITDGPATSASSSSSTSSSSSSVNFSPAPLSPGAVVASVDVSSPPASAASGFSSPYAVVDQSSSSGAGHDLDDLDVKPVESLWYDDTIADEPPASSASREWYAPATRFHRGLSRQMSRLGNELELGGRKFQNQMKDQMKNLYGGAIKAKDSLHDKLRAIARSKKVSDEELEEDDGKPVFELKDINCIIPKGSLTCIVGAVGAGKHKEEENRNQTSCIQESDQY